MTTATVTPVRARAVRVPPTADGSSTRVGFWTAASTAAAALVALTASVGPGPTGGRARADGSWTYAAFPVLVALVVLTAVLVGLLLGSARPLVRGSAVAGGTATLLAVTLLQVDYGVQLFVLRPALARRQADGLTPWYPDEPGGLSVGLHDLGCGILALGLVLLGAALLGTGPRARRAAGAVLLGSGALALVTSPALGGFGPAGPTVHLGVGPGGLTWAGLACACVLLARSFAAPAGAGGARVSSGPRPWSPGTKASDGTRRGGPR